MKIEEIEENYTSQKEVLKDAKELIEFGISHEDKIIKSLLKDLKFNLKGIEKSKIIMLEEGVEKLDADEKHLIMMMEQCKKINLDKCESDASTLLTACEKANETIYRLELLINKLKPIFN